MRVQGFRIPCPLRWAAVCCSVMLCDVAPLRVVAAPNTPAPAQSRPVPIPFFQQLPPFRVRDCTLTDMVAYLNTKSREQLSAPVVFTEEVSKAKILVEYDAVIRFPLAVDSLVTAFTNARIRTLSHPRNMLGKKASFEFRGATVEAVASRVASAYGCDAFLLQGTNVLFDSDAGEVQIYRYERPPPVLQEGDAMVAVDPTYGIYAWSRLPADEGVLVLGSQAFHLFRCRLADGWKGR